ncbi:MAG: tetratricopeptide repeat protein [Syntrophobacterales bacterium]|jgi:tetratricopeptide (TPR) repeat protein
MKKLFLTILIYMMMTCTAVWAQNAMYFYNRGLESSMVNRRIHYFSKALQLNPNLVEAYEKRAIHYYFQQRFDNAIQDYTKVIELKPTGAEAYRMLGLAQLKKGDLDGAIDNFDRAIQLDPRPASSYGYRGEAYRLKGLPQEAMRDSTKAIQLRGDARTTARAYRTRAKIYHELGEYELSDADFRRYVELDPRFYLFRYFANTASLEAIHRIGLIGIIAITFLTIFKVALPAPRKSDED